jgi:hypothetical protein
LRGAVLLVSQAVFLWMFLAADPLERLAAAGAFGSEPHVVDAAFAFAAAWRHGMAGNSPLYMPGFFLTAVASWIWSETSGPRAAFAFAASLASALALAWIAAVPATPAVVAAFERAGGVTSVAPVDLPRWGAAAAGLYTLLTWTAFVVGARLACATRRLTPLAPVPILTIGLVLVRPWTVGDFTGTWADRAIQGDPMALLSLALIPALATFLVRRELHRATRGSLSCRLNTSRSCGGPFGRGSEANRRRRRRAPWR